MEGLSPPGQERHQWAFWGPNGCSSPAALESTAGPRSEASRPGRVWPNRLSSTGKATEARKLSTAQRHARRRKTLGGGEGPLRTGSGPGKAPQGCCQEGLQPQHVNSPAHIWPWQPPAGYAPPIYAGLLSKCAATGLNPWHWLISGTSVKLLKCPLMPFTMGIKSPTLNKAEFVQSLPAGAKFGGRTLSISPTRAFEGQPGVPAPDPTCPSSEAIWRGTPRAGPQSSSVEPGGGRGTA